MMPPIAEWSTVIVSIIYLVGAWTVTILMARALCAQPRRHGPC